MCTQLAGVAWFGDCLVSLAKAVQETRYGSELPFLHGEAKTVGSSPPSFVDQRLVGRLQPLASPSVLIVFNGNFQGEDVDGHCGVGVNDGMPLLARQTRPHGVRQALDRCERHTRFVGKCAEQTRQPWSMSSSFASLSVRQLFQTCAKNKRNNTNKHVFAHSPTVCAGVLGLLHHNVRLACRIFSMCHRDFK